MKQWMLVAVAAFAVILLFLGGSVTGALSTVVTPPVLATSVNPTTSKYITTPPGGLTGGLVDKIVTYQALGVADLIASKTGIPGKAVVGGAEAYIYAATPAGNAVAVYDAVTHPIDTAKSIGSAAASAWHSVSSIF